MFRRLPLPLLLAFLIATAGCVGVLTGSEPLTLESSPVSVSSAAQSDTGYEESRVTTQELEREVSAAGQTREVIATNHIAEYARTIDAGPMGSGEFARFVVVSTPAVEVLGKTFNPVGEMSNRELAELAQDQYQGLSNIAEEGERSVTLLGSQTTVTRFSADAMVQGTGQTVELTLHVTRLRHGDDFIVIIAAHPTLLTGETGKIDRLLEGVQHDG
ncbi:MAG: DUF6517 family protein [Halobacteriales archaeon]|nr:DUF6517 family protein [Halobacteriales archaeon]